VENLFRRLFDHRCENQAMRTSRSSHCGCRMRAGGCHDRRLSDPARFSTHGPKSGGAKRSTSCADVDNQPRVSSHRAIVYLWVFPTTCAGLLFLPFIRMTGGSYQVIDGVLELYGGIVEFVLRRCTLLEGGASAMTLGHVVLGRNREALDGSRQHERVHVRQCERWGPLFLPAYGIASLIAMARGQRAYLDNPFEREAYSITTT
jgi:hypothetical protein